MSFFPLAAIVVGFWFCVHLRSHYVTKQATILPLTTTTAIRPSNILYIHKGFTVERSSLFVVRMKSSLFLNSHAKLSARWSSGLPVTSERRTKGFKWRRFWKFFYDMGSLVAIAGQLSALILLAMLVLQMGKRALGEPELWPILSKRAIEPVNRISLKSTPSLKPLVISLRSLPCLHQYD